MTGIRNPAKDPMSDLALPCKDAPVADSPEAVLLAEARRSIGEQRVTLDALQSKSMTVLGAGAIVAAVAAPRIAGHNSSAILVSVALAAFAIGALLAIDILQPRHWQFGEKLPKYSQWTRDHRDEPGADRSFSRGLANNLEADFEKNQTALDKITDRFTWQCALLALQVICWAVAYAVA